MSSTNFTTRLCMVISMLAWMHTSTFAQLPTPALVGYWQNWNDPASPYIQLDQVDARYNVIEVAFGVPINGTDYQIGFTPDGVSQSTFISQLQYM